MEIKTKYNIGDKVWVIADNEPTEFLIDSIEIFILNMGQYGIGQSIWYVNKENEGYERHQVFPTKEELLKSL